MKIQCPSCRFERDVPESSLRPGKTYKVTCPRCSSIFHFSRPEEEFIIEAEENAPAQPLADSSSPARNGEAEASAQAAAPAGEQKPAADVQGEPSGIAGGDVQAPGAAASEAVQEESQAEEPAQEKPADGQAEADRREAGSGWASAHEGRENAHEEEGVRREDGRPDGAPWESPEYYGFVGSFTRTLLGALFHAPEFFRNVKCQFSVIRPILFYVLLSVFQVLCARLWSIKALRELSATATDPQTLAMAEQLMQSMNMPLMLLITPFFSILQAMFLAGIYHLMIRMVQPDRADFATTLRVVCYSAAPLVLCLVPMVGSVIATAWSVACVFIGCRYALRLSWLRTVLALLPLYILELAVITQIPALMSV